MHLVLCVLLAICVVLPSEVLAKKLAVSIQAESGIVINADTGAILFEKKAHEQHYPASITKIATAIYALNTTTTPFDTIIIAPKDAIGVVTDEAMRKSNYTLPAYYLTTGVSTAGIKEGEELSFKDLFYGMMIPSGGDAANIIAKHVGGTIPDFMAGVNEYIKKIGLTQTTFYNPHGLHHPKQLTTAHDMAILTREAMKNPTFKEIVSTVRYTRPKTNKQEAAPWIQTNRLLRSGPFFYPKAIGVKTGYYSLAGSTLVAAAKDGDRTLIVVLLKEKERKDLFQDAIKLFEAAFAQPKVQRVFLKKGPQKFSLDLPGATKVVGTYTKEDLVLEYYPAEEQVVKCFLQWNRDLVFPISKDQYVGELVLQQSDGRVVKSEKLYSADATSATFIHRTKIFSQKWLASFSWGKVIVIFLILGSIGFVIYRKK